MTARVIIAIDDEVKHTGVRLREVVDVVRNVNMMTVAYVTVPIRSWGTTRELFEEHDTGMAHYLFDELEEAERQKNMYRNRAKVSLQLSDELKVENERLRLRIENLEKKSRESETTTTTTT
jgi:hypothetical protein